MKVRTGVFSAAMLAISTGAWADFPSREITIQVPFSPGTSADPLAREFGELLARQIHRPVIIDNKMGAEGQIGAMAVLNAKPDGHQILFTSSSQPIYDALLKDGLPFDFRMDFRPLCALASTSNVLTVAKGGKFNQVRDFIADAQKSPGKLTYAYATSAQRVAAEMFMQAAHIQLNAIPYKSSMTAMTDLAGQQVDAIFIDHNASLPLVQSKRLKPLLVSGSERIKVLPDTPAASEVPLNGYNIQPWFGFYASGKTPDDVAQKLIAVIQAVLASDKNKDNISKRGLKPLLLCGEDFRKFQDQDFAQAQKALRADKP